MDRKAGWNVDLYVVLKVQSLRNLARWLSWLERRPVTAEVVGSSPIQVATYADLAHLVERHLAKVEVASSSLVIRSNFGAIAKW